MSEGERREEGAMRETRKIREEVREGQGRKRERLGDERHQD